MIRNVLSEFKLGMAELEDDDTLRPLLYPSYSRLDTSAQPESHSLQAHKGSTRFHGTSSPGRSSTRVGKTLGFVPEERVQSQYGGDIDGIFLETTTVGQRWASICILISAAVSAIGLMVLLI